MTVAFESQLSGAGSASAGMSSSRVDKNQRGPIGPRCQERVIHETGALASLFEADNVRSQVEYPGWAQRAFFRFAQGDELTATGGEERPGENRGVTAPQQNGLAACQACCIRG